MSKSYEVHLWEGIKIAVDRFADGKRIMKEAIDLFDTFIEAEEHYSKTVQKTISKLASVETKGSSHKNRTVNGAWIAIRNQVDSVSKHHATMSNQIQQKISNSLSNFKKEQTKMADQLEADAAKLSKEMKEMTANLSKAKQKYHSSAKELESTNQTLEKGQSPPKEQAKLKVKLQGLQKQTEQADQQYKSAVQDHRTFQTKYADEMKKILSQLEEKRGSFLEELFDSFLFSQEASISNLQQAFSLLKIRIDAIDYNGDLQLFLEENNTKQAPPPLVEYEPFNGQSVQTIDAVSPNTIKKSDSLANTSTMNENVRESKRESQTDEAPNTGKKLPTPPVKSIQPNRLILKPFSSFIRAQSPGPTPTPTPQQPINPLEERRRTNRTLPTPATKAPEPQQQSQETQPTAQPANVPTKAKGVMVFPVTGGPLNLKKSQDVNVSQNKQPAVASPKKEEKVIKAKATFDYDAEEANELSFKENDIIVVSKIDESGWWEGTCNGKFGMFPGNYVELIKESTPAQTKAPPPQPAPQPAPVASKERKVKALFDFDGDDTDELPIKEGEILTIVSEAEGWILGVNSKGAQGLFPANYVGEIK